LGHLRADAWRDRLGGVHAELLVADSLITKLDWSTSGGMADPSMCVAAGA
jgi:hypothetical protein